MIYLRLFNNHSEYEEYVASQDYITPNVSGCKLEQDAHFDYGISVPVTGVTLDKASIELNNGETQTLVATVMPLNASTKTVVWSSSDNTVATVTNGVVTAVGCGNATITVTTVDGGYTAQCETTVVGAVNGVTLNESEISLTKGGTTTLVATVSPSYACDKEVSWSSSDNTIATVANGVVAAVGCGSAIITVTTTDGDFSAQCSVATTVPSFTSMAIEGASAVSAETCAYRAICDNTDDVTSSATWSITAGSQYATINSSNGEITILNGASQSSVTIQAVYNDLTATTTVTLTYLSGAESETTSEITTDASGNTTSVVTTVTTYQDGSSTEVVESVKTDENGDVIGSSQGTTNTAADGSYVGTTTNYDASGNPVDGSNVSGDTDHNVSTQSVEYDETGGTVVTGYEIDTSGNTGGTKSFSGDGVNTEYYAFDVTRGFVLDINFLINYSQQPPGQNENHHNILTAKRATPSPWYGFQIRQSSTNKYIQLGTQFSTGSNTNTTINHKTITGNTAEFNLTITYNPTASTNSFVCYDNIKESNVYTSNLKFPDIAELKYLKVVIGYAMDANGDPYRYSNIDVKNFNLRRI